MQVLSQSVQWAAQKRLQESLPEQREAKEKIEAGRPLEAEQDENRKLAYIQRRVKCSRSVAERIAANEDPAVLPLSEGQRSQAESLQGKTVDFMPICFLDVARAASRSVAIVTFENRSPQGTGFMVSPRLFLTNQHVVPSKEAARGLFLEFAYELDPDKQTIPVTRFRLDPDAFYLNDPIDDLDYALVAIGPKISGPLSASELGFLPLVDAPDKWITSGFVNIIQHPGGDFKQLVVRENRILHHTNHTLIYGTDTLPGSSGSPVFNDEWEVLALHHWGEPHRARLDVGAGHRPVPEAGNEGIRVSAILRELLDKLPNLPGPAERALLSEVLNPGFRHPSLLTARAPQAETTPSLPTAPMNIPATTGNGSYSVTVPLTITLSFGPMESKPGATIQPPVPPPAGPDGEGGEAVIFKPDPNYETRKGYDPSFLGVTVLLPKLTPQQTSQLAQLRQASGANRTEFKYQHFSVLMNRVRRLPFFTAVNIDGSSVVTINRETGKVTREENPSAEAAEAREKWYDDPRISPDETTQDSLYLTPGFRIFQRGHLVKRTDPSWGNRERAFKGQSDTFHFTNAAPQHASFNPINARWAGVEEWISRVSDRENIRITVFCGPVFHKTDPVISGLAIPKRFWKVIVWVQEGRVRATGILADQSDLLPGSEGLDNPAGDPKNKFPKTYHVSIARIENLTKLKFGEVVRGGDTFQQGGESLSGEGEMEFTDLEQLRSALFGRAAEH